MGYGVWGSRWLMVSLFSTSPPPSPGDVTYETPSDVVGDSSPDTGQDMAYEVVENVPPHEVVQNVPPHEVQR